MRAVIVVVVVGLGLGLGLARDAAAAPPTDRAAAAIPIPAKAAAQDLCAVQRTLYFDGTSAVDLVYATGGRITRRERWSGNTLAAVEDHAWSKDRRELVVTSRGGDFTGTRRTRFDARGLVIAVSIDHASKLRRDVAVTLAWDVTPLERPVALHRPTATDPETFDLPWQLPVMGVVQVTGGTEDTTLVYGQHGTRLVHGCKLDASGRETTCGSGDARKTITWTNDHLASAETRTTTERPARVITRDRYRYDADHRVIRAERARETTGGGLGVAWLSRVDYRCAGVAAYREPP